MTDSTISYWDKKHHFDATQDWINLPSIFAKWVVKYFPAKGKILELGAGHGQDSRYFVKLGYEVIATDFSSVGLDYHQQKSRHIAGLKIMPLDLREPFPFPNNNFEVVYAHLALHFFDNQMTTKIFQEIYRVLKSKGILALMVNSTADPEYGAGQQLENGLYRMDSGLVKRFFTQTYLAKKTTRFYKIILDNQGSTYKDKSKGVENLIRFVGQK